MTLVRSSLCSSYTRSGDASKARHCNRKSASFIKLAGSSWTILRTEELRIHNITEALHHQKPSPEAIRSKFGQPSIINQDSHFTWSTLKGVPHLSQLHMHKNILHHAKYFLMNVIFGEVFKPRKGFWNVKNPLKKDFLSLEKSPKSKIPKRVSGD